MATPYNTPYYSAVQSRRASDDLMRVTPDMFSAGDDHSSEDFDYSGLISGALGLAGTYEGMANQGLGLQKPPGLQLSATGEPVYNLGSAYNQAFSARPQGATGGEILSGAGQGAAAGAAFGPIGIGVGAVVGGAVSIFGGNRRKKKQRNERRKSLASIGRGQQEYNRASQSFDREQLALDDYHRRADLSNQLYNLYR